MMNTDQLAKYVNAGFYTQDQLPKDQVNTAISQQAWPTGVTSPFFDPVALTNAITALQAGDIMGAWLAIQGQLLSFSGETEQEQEIAAAQQEGEAKNNSRVW
jgi:hypothetical protein